jgi:hypothetical protein
MGETETICPENVWTKFLHNSVLKENLICFYLYLGVHVCLTRHQQKDAIAIREKCVQVGLVCDVKAYLHVQFQGTILH